MLTVPPRLHPPPNIFHPLPTYCLRLAASTTCESKSLVCSAVWQKEGEKGEMTCGAYRVAHRASAAAA